MPAGAALVAVGGYGRGELFPYSDVDVLVLLPGRRTEAGKREAIERFISALLGHRPGDRPQRAHGRRMRRRARPRDVTVQTALLEARLPRRQPRRCFSSFRGDCARRCDAAAFFAPRRWRGAAPRQVRGHALLARAERKEAPGGLRDLQSDLWVARAARPRAHAGASSPRSGLIDAVEARQLARNEGAAAADLRMRLHYARRAARGPAACSTCRPRSPRSFGYVDTPGAARQRSADAALLLGGQGGDAAQHRSCCTTSRSGSFPARGRADAADQRALPSAASCSRCASDDLYQREPHAILETFLAIQQHHELQGHDGAHAARAVQRAPADGREFRRDPVEPRDLHADPAAAARHHARVPADEPVGVLGRYLWVFRRIVGQMQHDLFHVYTVDQHILMVLRNVRRFIIPEHAHEYPFCSQLDRPASSGRGCSTSPRCSTTSPRAAAATIPSSARARRGASAATTGCRARTRELVEFLVERAPDDVARSRRRRTSPTPR